MSHSLKHTVFKSSAWSLIGASGRQLSGLVVFIVLSRLLNPSDFGTLAIAVAFVEGMNMVVRLGLSTELVRNNTHGNEERSTAFWMSLAAGLCATVLLFCFSGTLAALFAAPEIAHALKLLCIIPTLVSLNVVHEALLQKEFEYKTLAMRTLVSNIGAGVVSIIMAYYGWGVYSLVFQSISSVLLTTLLYWSFLKWRPSFTFSKNSARQQLQMGRPQMANAMLTVISGRSIDVIVGYFLGTAAVGYLRIAAKLYDFLVQFTIEPIASVALPTFAKLQDDHKALSNAYTRLAQACSLFTFPAFFGLAAIAPTAIMLVFGEKWLPSAHLMQILCFASAGATVNYFFKPAMLSIGRPGVLFKVNLCQTTLMVCLITLAAQFNIYAVSTAQVFAILVFLTVTQNVLHAQIGLQSSHILHTFYPPLVSSVTMAAIVFLLQHAPFMPAKPIYQLIILAPTGAAIYAGMLYFGFPAYLATIREKILPVLLSGKLGNRLKFLRKA